MFDKLLIANRGEIACRIARTARRLGVRTVAVYSDADASAAHVAACDEAVRIGGARPQDSYLRGEVILEAARRTGAQALHPGYGFLSENAGFARACAVAGVVFIGPSPEAIAAMGSKSAAKALMGRTGVPLTPGYHGDRQDDDYLLEQACHVGFPVLIKAVSGGGGKGMRRVDRAADFSAALAGCRREALASFADQRVLVEQFVTPARHIEVQVFGDGRGGGVYLFERDCSVQRRHQKVLEEAPAPGMTPERRRRMGEAAVAAAGAVNYAGAGTVEFIVAADGEFYFMEMNTRLQVEHAVTEMITGVDLVEWQLRMAAGEPMPLRQAELAIHGHAIEARIYAEDPGRDFLPSIGRLEYLATPATDADLRIDTGVRQGDEITPFYDPMLAKLIAHGATREAAIARLQTALAGFHVAGVQTNREFLGRLITSPSFLAPQLDTGLIAREHEHLFPHLDPPADEIWQRAAWASLVLPSGGTSPWDDIGGWRPGGRAERLVTLRWRDSQRALRIGFSSKPAPAADVAVVRAANAVHVFAGPQHHQFQIMDPYLPRFEVGDRHDGLIAPMPGRIIAINVAVGDAVTRGMPLVVMEAMKMEHTVTAPADGKVERILCAVGEQVPESVELLVLGMP